MAFKLDDLLDRVSKIKLSGGVVGKVVTCTIVACLAIAVLGVMSGNAWIMGGAILVILIISFPILWRLISFADKNPQAALLEGAEFITHQKLVLASKDEPEIPFIEGTQVEEVPLNLTAEQRQQLEQPDVAKALPKPGERE